MLNLAKTFENEIVLKTLKASRILSKIYNARLKKYEITDAGYTSLLAFHLYPETSLTTLGDIIGVDRTTLSRMAEGLLNLGLIKKVKYNDCRVKFHCLTPTGVETLNKCVAATSEINNMIGKKVDKNIKLDTMLQTFSLLSNIKFEKGESK